MSFGPAELFVIEFPCNQFKGEIIPALKEVVDQGIIRIIDIIFVKKTGDGNLTVLEMNDLDDEDYEAFNLMVADITGLLSEDDVHKLSTTLEPNSSAAIILLEHLWATRLRDVIVNTQGKLILNERIPRKAIESALSARAQPVA